MANKESDTFSCQNGQLKIGPDGVAENGTLCRWKGFDKTKDEFWGIPIKPNVNQPSKTVETSQK